MDRAYRQSLYKTRRWHRLRAIQLRDEPLCRFCKQLGYTIAATVVDHIKPHRGDEGLFYDQRNLQSLCQSHHNSAKQRAESSGMTDIGCDKHGYPLDKNHHWNL